MTQESPERTPEHRLREAAKQLRLYAEETDDEQARDLARLVELEEFGETDEGVPLIREVQRRTAEWRHETINGDISPLSQAAHTSVEANELLDLLVKGETYDMSEGPVGGWSDDEGRQKAMEEAGDVIVAHLGTLSLLGVDVVDAIDAALEKNGARDWDGWQR